MQKTLESIVEIKLGYPFRSRVEPDATGSTAIVQMKDIDEQDLLHVESMVRVNLEYAKEQYDLKVGDVIFRSRGKRNTAALVAAPLGSALLAAPLMLIRITSDEIMPGYVQWYLNQPSTQRRLDIMPTSTTGRMIGISELRKFEIDVPPLEVQQTIQTISGLCQKEQQLTQEIAATRQSLWEGILMQHATRGPQDTG